MKGQGGLDGQKRNAGASACMMAALKETQDTIRSYDTKAQIVGVGFIFTLGVLTEFGEKLTGAAPETNAWIVIGFWLLFIGPAILFGAVLYPSRRGQEGEQASGIRNVFYLGGRRDLTLDHYLDELAEADWNREIAHELIKTNRLREIKRTRFIRALVSVMVSYVLVALFQMLRAEGIMFL